MTESKKAQAVDALRKCAKAHEKDFTFTCEIRVSDLCNGVADYVEKLQKENEQLKKDKEWLENTDNEQTNLILKLYEQIEKMKNVGNCKKAMTCAEWNEKQTMLSCMKFCKDCKEWELAE